MSFASNFNHPQQSQKAIDPNTAVAIEGKKQRALIVKEATTSKVKIEEHLKMVGTAMYNAKQEIDQLVLIKKEEAKEVCHVMNKLKLDLKAERLMIGGEMKKTQSAHQEQLQESNEAIVTMKQLLQQLYTLKNELVDTHGSNKLVVEDGPPLKKMGIESKDGKILAVNSSVNNLGAGYGYGSGDGSNAGSFAAVQTDMNVLVTPEYKPTATALVNPYAKKANYAGDAAEHGTAKDMTQEFDSEELDAELVEMKLPADNYDYPDAAQMDAAQTLGNMASKN